MRRFLFLSCLLATHAERDEQGRFTERARALLDEAVDEGFDHDINPLVLFDIVEPCEPPLPLSSSSAIGTRRAVSATSDGDAVLWDCVELPEVASTDRRATKLIKLHSGALLSLITVGELLVSGGADGHCIPQQVPPGGVGINAPENEDYSWTIMVPLGDQTVDEHTVES